MGMSLLGYDVAPVSSAFSVETGLRQVDLETLLGGSDLVILTCALTPENHHLLNEKTLREIKPGAMIVNVARGPLIKEAALLDALTDGRISRSEEHTSELQSLMRISYAVFCLKKKNTTSLR